MKHPTKVKTYTAGYQSVLVLSFPEPVTPLLMKREPIAMLRVENRKYMQKPKACAGNISVDANIVNRNKPEQNQESSHVYEIKFLNHKELFKLEE